jgi:hypothetical protein
VARGTQLLRLVNDLRSELKESTNPAHGVNTLETYKYKLNAQQEFLYNDYAWPFLNGSFDVTTQAGERYYDLPVDPGTIRRVEFKWNGIWFPLANGISGRNYNAQNSEDDQRADPVQRWQFYGSQQFEVWPIPATERQHRPLLGARRRSRRWSRTAIGACIDDRLIVLVRRRQSRPERAVPAQAGRGEQLLSRA